MLLLAAGCASGPELLPGPLPAGVTLAGAWDTNWGRMELTQHGDVVRGGYEHHDGLIEGRLEGDLFRFTWNQPGDRKAGVLKASGHGWLRVSQDGLTMEGGWGYRDAWTGGGGWKAERVLQE